MRNRGWGHDEHIFFLFADPGNHDGKISWRSWVLFYQVQVYGSASFSLMQNGIAASTIYFFRIRVHLAVGACKYNRIIINISAVFYNQYSIKAQINGRKISLEWFYPDSTDASYKNFNWLVLIVWYDQLKWIVGYILFLNHIRNILGLSRAL